MTLIQRKDGTMYDLLDAGIRTRNVLISSSTPIHHFEEVEGGNGVIDYGTTYGPREITCYYRAQSSSITGFSLLRDEIFNLFRTEESFYLIEKRERGKRWLVKVVNPFAIPQRNVYGDFEVEFIGIRGVSESIGTTQDIHNNGINADDGLWGFGMGLEAVDESLIYTHNATVNKPFFIYNAGDVSIHPFEQKFKMTISNVRGSTERFQITNHTNGSRARINVPLRSTDVVVYDGPNVTRNKLTFLRDTRKDFIELSPGWNNFRIYYCDSATISFDFPFYYL